MILRDDPLVPSTNETTISYRSTLNLMQLHVDTIGTSESAKYDSGYGVLDGGLSEVARSLNKRRLPRAGDYGVS